MPRFPAAPSEAGGLAALALLVALQGGCRREDPRIRDLTRQAERAETAAQELRRAWADQQRKFLRAGLGSRRPDDATLVLTPEQKHFLEDRINREKDSSRQALLREILAQDVRIAGLRAEVARLREGLPRPDLVRVHESHHGLALRFLRSRGVPEAEARRLLSRTPLLDKLAPGFEVYHFHGHGSYGTWVGQGTAAVSPADLNAGLRAAVEKARDDAQDQARRTRREVAELARQKRAVEAEIAEVRSEYGHLLAGRAALSVETEAQAARLNALHHRVGLRKELEAAGIIEVPFFGPPRAGRAWSDGLFRDHLDLRERRSLTVRAADHGLPRIGRVVVVPGSLLEGEHYRLDFGSGRRTVTLEILAPERFRNTKLALALSE